VSDTPRPALVALIGNPNTGKTTLFNRLTGKNARVGNYPGVTVDRSLGRLPTSSRPGGVQILDVPGAYSLNARSAEEQITFAAVLGRDGNPTPDLVAIILDPNQLSRNLYLAIQVAELGLPALLVINMIDEAGPNPPDPEAIASFIGLPTVAVSARTGQGIDALLSAVEAALDSPPVAVPAVPWAPALQRDVDRLASELPADWHTSETPRNRAIARWALGSIDDDDELVGIPDGLRSAVGRIRANAQAEGRDLDLELVAPRYALLDGMGPLGTPPARSLTERVDAVLLHPVAGFMAFLVIMLTLFQLLFAGADPFIGLIEDGVGWLGGQAASVLPASVATDLLVEGVIGGVGNVIVFLPQILLLFFFIGLLEDSGYMSRAAYLMDRVMRVLGLHGRAFVPMLSGFACAVPAILATRTMERRRDRLLTMMVVPLMTCSARLPVYTLVVAAVYAPTAGEESLLPVQGLMMMAMYLFSVMTALIAAWVIGRTVLRGPHVPLILELPPYRLPALSGVMRMMWMRARAFLKEAGTVILFATIVMWALLRFPELPEPTGGLEAAPPGVVTAYEAQKLEFSAAGRLGKGIEPALRPLGFDWKGGVGIIGAFAAREVFVSTMGLVYGVGTDVDEDSVPLRDRLREARHADGTPVWTPLSGVSLMVFFALACQCMSTLAVVRRETGGWRWPAFLFTYMTALAWLASFVVFQGGRLLGFS
jgi:ferrous iron transport protein B